MLGRDGRPKTGKSKRDVVIHANLLEVLRSDQPIEASPDDFVFITPTGAPIDEVNFYRREWKPMLESLRIRQRSFYNTRHTYITYLLSLGVSPLFVSRQTGTSLEMIEKHYGGTTVIAEELDRLLRRQRSSCGRNSAVEWQPTKSKRGNPGGTFILPSRRTERETEKIKGNIQHLGKERATGVEPATSSLGSWHSTAELRPQELRRQALQTVSKSRRRVNALVCG